VAHLRLAEQAALAVAVGLLLTPLGQRDKALLAVQAPQHILVVAVAALVGLGVTLFLVVQAVAAALLLLQQLQALRYLALAAVLAAQLMYQQQPQVAAAVQGTAARPP
jgi:hypothetical protein